MSQMVSVKLSREVAPLPYAYNALEPYIDEQTMHVHHDKHHAAYLTNLVNVLDKYPERSNEPRRICCAGSTACLPKSAPPCEIMAVATCITPCSGRDETERRRRA